MLGTPEIAVVAVVLLLLFGGRKIPEMARSLGRAQHEFRAGISESAAGESAPSDDATAHPTPPSSS